MHLTFLQYCAGLFAGGIVGFSLGLVGGGGSILAVPLLVYGVGVTDPHVAIGTSAMAVAASAGVNLFHHARCGSVQWKIAGVFALAGVVGAWFGSLYGKAFDGQKLLTLFAVLMIGVGVSMLRTRCEAGGTAARLDSHNAWRLVVAGGSAGAISGFFGVGGGFLIVPGLMYAARLPLLCAVGSSLVAVSAFAATTAVNYARSGWVDWALAAVFIGGGVVGGTAGAWLSRRLSARGVLNRVFAGVIFLVGAYMFYRSTDLSR